MDSTFSQKLILTIILAAATAGIIQAARHSASSVERTMDSDTLKTRTPVPTPRRF